MFHVIIPARYAASRLPGKPLLSLGDKPVVQWVWESACASGAASVIVATDDERILAAARAFGADCSMTSPRHASGTDRIAEVVRARGMAADDIVVNLQGDFPTIVPAQLRAVIDPLVDPLVDIGTLVVPIISDEEANTASFVKAACAFDYGQRIAPALYFSRTPIPWGDGPRWHHVGIYAYRREALIRYVALPESPLERREKLEQLRALEAGMRISCVRIEHGPFGVDTPEDLERARRLLDPRGAL